MYSRVSSYTVVAENMLETCIQYGFNVKGMYFNAVPGYELEIILKTIEA